MFLNFPKNQRTIWQVSAPESKKWSNHKIKAHYNDFDTNFVGFLENLRLSKRHSEINWPLSMYFVYFTDDKTNIL